MSDRAIVADARAVTPRQFLDSLGLSSPEVRAKRDRELREQCIRAISRGDTYGWPPALLAECRKLIEEQESLTEETHGDPFKGRFAA